MKKLLLSVFAIAAMASCMQDEVISQDQQAIDFGAPFVEKATKATDNTYSGTADLTEFKVYGTVTGTAGTVNIFNNATVSGTVGPNSVWTCDVKQYWIPGANYNFAAVVDAETVGQDHATLMPTTLVPATDADGYLKDLLYDETTVVGQESNNEEVAIVFEHLLAKAHFTVKSNTVGTYYHKVTGIKINNFSTGTYTIDGGTWSTASATPDKAYDLYDAVANITSNDTAGVTNATQVLLYPTTTDFTVEFTVELWNSKGTDGNPALLSQVHYTNTPGNFTTGTTKPAKEVSTDLLKGNAYNFILDLKVGEEIKFTVAESPEWVNTTDVSVTL